MTQGKAIYHAIMNCDLTVLSQYKNRPSPHCLMQSYPVKGESQTRHRHSVPTVCILIWDCHKRKALIMYKEVMRVVFWSMESQGTHRVTHYVWVGVSVLQWRSVPFKMREDDHFFLWAWPYFYYSILDDSHSYSIHSAQCNIDRSRRLHDSLLLYINVPCTHHEVATT